MISDTFIIAPVFIPKIILWDIMLNFLYVWSYIHASGISHVFPLFLRASIWGQMLQL